MRKSTSKNTCLSEMTRVRMRGNQPPLANLTVVWKNLTSLKASRRSRRQYLPILGILTVNSRSRKTSWFKTIALFLDRNNGEITCWRMPAYAVVKRSESPKTEFSVGKVSQSVLNRSPAYRVERRCIDWLSTLYACPLPVLISFPSGLTVKMAVSKRRQRSPSSLRIFDSSPKLVFSIFLPSEAMNSSSWTRIWRCDRGFVRNSLRRDIEGPHISSSRSSSRASV